MKKVIRKIRAKIFGYFWMPCPICGEYFGGFEVGSGYVVIDDKNMVCCRQCSFTAGQIDGIKNKQPLVAIRALKFIED